MPKAHLTMKGGTTVVIEGSTEEVAALIKKFDGDMPTRDQATRRRGPKETGSASKATPQNLVSSLIDGGFFRKPKDLATVKVALEEMGHFYPVTTLSPALLRMVRARQLRRIRDKKRWMYTG